MGPSRICCFALFLVLLANGRAQAFDYIEHARITHAGIRLFLRLDDAGLSNAPPRAVGENCDREFVCGRRKEFLAELAGDIRSTHACPVDREDSAERVNLTGRFFEYAPPGCFSISDIPALAGDHAPTPMFLKWKWFNDYLKPQDQNSMFEVSLELLSGLSSGHGDPGTARMEPPAVSQFIQFVRRHASRSWPVTPSCTEGAWDPRTGVARPKACNPEDRYPSDAEFLLSDAHYGGLAERGHPHFRPGVCAPSRQLAAPPRRDLGPELQSFAWYADLHTGAIALAQYGQRNKEWLGTAVLLELYALHFLEDAVAAGHMRLNASDVTNAMLNAVHDDANRDGVLVAIPDQLCDLFESTHGESQEAAVKREYLSKRLPELRRACNQSGRRVTRVYGDHSLEAVGVESTSASITFEWAALLVSESLEELYEAQLSKPASTPSEVKHWWHAPLDAQQLQWRDDSRSGVAPRGSPEREAQLLSLARSAWWWSIPPESARKAIADQYESSMRALKMVPQPVLLAGQSESACDGPGLRETYTENEFGGTLAEASTGPAVAVDELRFAGHIAVGFGLAPPPRRLPVQALVRFTASNDGGVATAGAQLVYRQFFSAESGFFITADGGVAAVARKTSPWTWNAGLGWLFRRQRYQHGPALLFGWDPVLGQRVMLDYVFSEAH